jgi:hypothetical protein
MHKWFFVLLITLLLFANGHLQGNSREVKKIKSLFLFAKPNDSLLHRFTSETNSTNKQQKRSFSIRIKNIQFPS